MYESNGWGSTGTVGLIGLVTAGEIGGRGSNITGSEGWELVGIFLTRFSAMTGYVASVRMDSGLMNAIEASKTGYHNNKELI
jgi:hypothetical protein